MQIAAHDEPANARALQASADSSGSALGGHRRFHSVAGFIRRRIRHSHAAFLHLANEVGPVE
eukprot:7388825-Prymnesium_polylepis.1